MLIVINNEHTITITLKVPKLKLTTLIVNALTYVHVGPTTLHQAISIRMLISKFVKSIYVYGQRNVINLKLFSLLDS